MKIVLLVLTLLCSSCLPPLLREISREDFGVVTETKSLDVKKTQVKTSKGFVIVIGFAPVIDGVETEIISYNNGSRWLRLKGTRQSWRIF